MILIVGGAYQGKMDFAVELSGKMPEKVMGDVHQWIRDQMQAGHTREGIERKLEEKISSCPDMILVADEIGYGIVPVDAFEREYRENAGRILCGLAKKADTVYRVVAGIPEKIKG